MKYFLFFSAKWICIQSTGALAQAGILPGMQGCYVTQRTLDDLWLMHFVACYSGAAPSENTAVAHTHTNKSAHYIKLFVAVLSFV